MDTEKNENTLVEAQSDQPAGSLHLNPEDEQLANLGLRPQSRRDLGALAIISAGWNISNSPAGVSAALGFSVNNAGTIGILYGCIVMLIFVGSSAATLAELSSVYPTAGGQYHWTSILAPKRYSRGLSFCCGTINYLGWITLSVGTCVVFPQFIMGLVISQNPTYEIKSWVVFLIYQAFNLVILAYNIKGLKQSAWIHQIGLVITSVSFVVITIVCLARSDPKQSSKFVWTTWINNSGWDSDAIAFLVSLVNANYIYGGIDGAIHIAEESTRPSTAVPLALLSTITIGFASAFAFAIAMLYTVSDFSLVLATPTKLPIFEIWRQATRSNTVATIFLFLLLITTVLAQIGNLLTASRLTWAIGRDHGILFSDKIGHMNRRLGVPLNALLFNSLLIAILGCIYPASSTAFNAMVGTGLILQQVSFAFPAAILLLRGRSEKVLPKDRKVNLGIFGWVANALTVVFAVIVTVFYDFPFVMPATAGNMNYTCAVLFIIATIGCANWFFYAKKHYKGPRLEA